MKYHYVTVRFFSFCFVLLLTLQVPAQKFSTVKTKEGIEIRENGKKVLFYQIKQKTVDGKFARAGYIHPLYSLNENSLTDDMPKDHPYHRGIFWAWHEILLQNKKLAEGWTSENISWYPTTVKVKRNKKAATLNAKVLWRSTLQKTPTDIIEENTTIKIYPATSHYRMLDFDIQLFPLIDSLKIGGSDDDKGYGGFCLRLKLPGDISFVSKNKTIIPQETAVVAGPWMDITGSFEGSSVPKTGVVVFANATDSGLQPWILRKVTSMQNVPYPGRTPVELSKEGLKLKYRVIVHNGEMSNDEIEKLYNDYVKETNS
jgi:hypothetical protein